MLTRVTHPKSKSSKIISTQTIISDFLCNKGASCDECALPSMVMHMCTSDSGLHLGMHCPFHVPSIGCYCKTGKGVIQEVMDREGKPIIHADEWMMNHVEEMRQFMDPDEEIDQCAYMFTLQDNPIRCQQLASKTDLFCQSHSQFNDRKDRCHYFSGSIDSIKRCKNPVSDTLCCPFHSKMPDAIGYCKCGRLSYHEGKCRS